MVQSIVSGDGENGMLAQDTALDRRRYCCGDDNPCQHRLIQISNDFLDRKRDGGDWSIESSSDPGGGSYRQQSSKIFT